MKKLNLLILAYFIFSNAIGQQTFLSGEHTFYLYPSSSFNPSWAGIRNNAGDVVFNSKNGGILYLNRDVSADVKIQSINTSTSQTDDIASFTNGSVKFLSGLNEFYVASGSLFFSNLAGIRNNGGDVIFNSKTGGTLYLNRDVNADVKIQYYNSSTSQNVDIATFSSTGPYKLNVCGTIRANEIKVDLLGGCDFVFKSNFKLMGLNELETFIKTNQHLPEIAPEKEMVENGVNMKELQMKLLQKIEELTLYTIEQNKKIIELEKQNKAIEELKQAMKLQREDIEKLKAASK